MTLSKKLIAQQKRYHFRVSTEYQQLIEVAGKERMLRGAPMPDASTVWSKASSGNADATSDVMEVHRESDLVSAIEGGKEDGEMHFWHCSFLKHAYPVASSGGGDPIVQIAAGEHRGEIYFANHECWYGGPSAVATGDESEIAEFMEDAEEVLEELEIESLNDLDTDTWVALMSNENLDFMFKIADSFQDLYRRFSAGTEEDVDAD